MSHVSCARGTADNARVPQRGHPRQKREKKNWGGEYNFCQANIYHVSPLAA